MTQTTPGSPAPGAGGVPRPSRTLISVIIPLFNEEAGTAILLDRCLGVLRGMTEDFEVVCVDDGSTDRTLEILSSYHQRDSRIKIVVLSRNFGHQAAFTAGLSFARGEYAVMMDGDLQDPPELIPLMYSMLLEKSCDVVYGRRLMHDEMWVKRLAVFLFHKTFRQFSHIRGADDVGNFSLFNRRVLDSLLQITEKHRYLPGLRFFVGFRQEPVEYRRESRGAGRSKMSVPKLFALAFDAIFSFSDIPIKTCLYAGMVGLIVTLAGVVYTLISKATGIAPLGWSSLIISIFFWGSVQLLFLGIIGEYIFRMYREIQDRPLYLVREYVD